MPTEQWKIDNVDKMRKYRRDYYSRNRDATITSVLTRREKLKAWYRKHKKTLVCLLCGENKPASLCFHHRDPSQKVKALSVMVHDGWSIEKLEKEMAKCEVWCHNCHMNNHYGHLFE